MSNQLKIEYESLFNTQINFSIYNINGQEIWATERRNRPGKNQFIWLGTSSRGRQVSIRIYFLTLDDGNKTIQEKNHNSLTLNGLVIPKIVKNKVS